MQTKPEISEGLKRPSQQNTAKQANLGISLATITSLPLPPSAYYIKMAARKQSFPLYILLNHPLVLFPTLSLCYIQHLSIFSHNHKKLLSSTIELAKKESNCSF